MSKILNFFLQAVFGSLTGAVAWAVIISLIAALVIYKDGYIKFEIFGAGSLEPQIPIILSAIFGLIQGLFIGLVIGIYNKDNILTGGLIGFAVTEIFLYSFYFISSLQMIFDGKSIQRAFDSMFDSNFSTFSFLLFIPSIFIGILITKLFSITGLVMKSAE